MKIEHVDIFEDLEQYLRGFKSFAGDPVPYDFNGAFHLFLALLDNLARNHLDADFEELEGENPWLTDDRMKFLKKLAR